MKNSDSSSDWDAGELDKIHGALSNQKRIIQQINPGSENIEKLMLQLEASQNTVIPELKNHLQKELEEKRNFFILLHDLGFGGSDCFHEVIKYVSEMRRFLSKAKDRRSRHVLQIAELKSKHENVQNQNFEMKSDNRKLVQICQKQSSKLKI
jgi:hypothetical protein